MIQETEIDSIKDDLKNINKEINEIFKMHTSVLLKYEVYVYISDLLFYIEDTLN